MESNLKEKLEELKQQISKNQMDFELKWKYLTLIRSLPENKVLVVDFKNKKMKG
jgi:hypothetical protein